MPPTNLLRGVALIAGAVFVFSLGDAATKYLTARYPVPLVGALRYGINFALLLLIFLPRGGRAIWRTERTGLVVLRACCLVAATLCMGFALQRMPLAESIAMVFLAPFGVLALSGPLLGERVTRAGWIAAAAGFAGVLMVVRPGAGLDPLGVVFGLGVAAATVGYNLLSRVLARTERTETLTLFSAAAGAVVFGTTLPVHLPDFAPPAFDLAVLAGLGLAATAGHLMFTAAFRHAPAHVLAPVNYLQLFWAVVFGLTFFGQRPDGIGIAGIVLIAGAGIAVTAGARRADRQARADLAAGA